MTLVAPPLGLALVLSAPLLPAAQPVWDEGREVYRDADPRTEVLDAGPRDLVRDADPRHEVLEAGTRREVLDADARDEVLDAETRREVR